MRLANSSTTVLTCDREVGEKVVGRREASLPTEADQEPGVADNGAHLN